MKNEVKYVAPISIDENKLNDLKAFLKQAMSDNACYVSLNFERKMLKELAQKLYDFAEDTSSKIKSGVDYYRKIQHSYEDYAEILKTRPESFMIKAKKLLKKGAYACASNPAEIIEFVNGKLNNVPLKLKKGEVLDLFNLSENKRLELAANLSKKNTIFVFNGRPNEKGEILNSQICGTVDFVTDKVYENKDYVDANYQNTLNVPKELKYKFNDVEFVFEGDVMGIKQELDEPYHNRIDFADDILYKTEKYLDNFFDKKSINKPDNTTLCEGLIRIADHATAVSNAMEKYSIERNNIETNSLAGGR